MNKRPPEHITSIQSWPKNGWIEVFFCKIQPFLHEMVDPKTSVPVLLYITFSIGFILPKSLMTTLTKTYWLHLPSPNFLSEISLKLSVILVPFIFITTCYLKQTTWVLGKLCSIYFHYPTLDFLFVVASSPSICHRGTFIFVALLHHKYYFSRHHYTDRQQNYANEEV